MKLHAPDAAVARVTLIALLALVSTGAAPTPPPTPSTTATPSATSSPTSAHPPATTPSANPTPTPTPVPARVTPQAWLGTVVRVTDDPGGVPSGAEEPDNPTVRWLDENAWRFGFVPGLPESETGTAIDHEPWTYRWVGRQMAASIQPLTRPESYGDQATAVLRQAEEELAAEGPSASAGATQGLSPDQ
jgi:D-alanyl-D-alanine carboxypeptidase